MKIVFLVTALALMVGCSRREEVQPVIKNHIVQKETPQAVEVSTEPGNYVVYRHCIDGIAYLTFANKSIIVQVDNVGDPMKCK